MQENINKYLNKENLRSYINLHNLGMLIVALVALSVSWSSTKIIQRNYDLLKQIAVLEQQIGVDEIAVANQKLSNEYYKTDTFLEISARRQLNKALPGEKMMLIPKSIAIERSKGLSIGDLDLAKPNKENLSNWQKWVRFLTGKAVQD